MSVINDMLRNLDARKANAAPVSAFPDEVRATPAPRRFQPVLVLLLLGLTAVLAIGLLTNKFVNLRPSSSAHGPTPVKIDAPSGSGQPAAKVVVPVGQSVAVASDSSVVESGLPDETRTATDLLRADPPPPVADAVHRHSKSVSNSPANSPENFPADARNMVASASVPGSKGAPVAEVERKKAKASPAAAATSTATTSLPHDDVSSLRVEPVAQSVQERLAEEVQRAWILMSRGELASAETALRAILAEDPNHQAARQTLAALLGRQLRDDDVRRVLKEGADLAPTDARAVMPYARLLAANGDFTGAAEVLARAADGMALNAEFHALRGAVLQRLARFADSCAEYRAALRLAPRVGAWWIGLGISLESESKPAEAHEAYLQARANPLSQDLAQFVEGKLQHLEGTH